MITRTITVTEAASHFNVLPCTVRSWIRSGRLYATKIGKQYYIPEPEVEKLLVTDKSQAIDVSNNAVRAELVSEFVDNVRIKVTAAQVWDGRRQRSNRRRIQFEGCAECR